MNASFSRKSPKPERRGGIVDNNEGEQFFGKALDICNPSGKRATWSAYEHIHHMALIPEELKVDGCHEVVA